MASLVVDTHNLVNHLESFGYNKKQAEGFVEVLQKLDISSLATKEDLKDLKNDLKLEISSIKIDMLKWAVPILLSQTGLTVGLTVALIKLIS